MRRTKVAEFNKADSPACVFLAMVKVGGHGINLHLSCHHMIICDIALNVNNVIQMIGRLVRTGQTKMVQVVILALDRSYDMKRQASIAAKMINVLAVTARSKISGGGGESFEATAKVVNEELINAGDEKVRLLQGQSCSRLKWNVSAGNYAYDFRDGHTDHTVFDAVHKFDVLLETYEKRKTRCEEIMLSLKGQPLWPVKEDPDDDGDSDRNSGEVSEDEESEFDFRYQQMDAQVNDKGGDELAR